MQGGHEGLAQKGLAHQCPGVPIWAQPMRARPIRARPMRAPEGPFGPDTLGPSPLGPSPLRALPIPASLIKAQGCPLGPLWALFGTGPIWARAHLGPSPFVAQPLSFQPHSGWALACIFSPQYFFFSSACALGHLKTHCHILPESFANLSKQVPHTFCVRRRTNACDLKVLTLDM